MPKSPVVVNEAGVSLKTAIENLNSENMKLKAKVGDLLGIYSVGRLEVNRCETRHQRKRNCGKNCARRQT